MPKDPVVQDGDPVLRQKAEPVAHKDITSPKIAKLIARMKKVLAGEDFGVALAAPQVGEPLRIFVIAGKAFLSPEDPAQKKVLGSPVSAKTEEAGRPDHFSEQGPPQPDRVFINPEITRLSRAKQEMSEGCLSVRGKYGTVLRHEKATIKALSEQGKPITYHGAGLIAHIFQHECDHLDGILYTDKAVKLEEDASGEKSRRKVGTPTKASGLKEKHGV